MAEMIANPALPKQDQSTVVRKLVLTGLRGLGYQCGVEHGGIRVASGKWILLKNLVSAMLRGATGIGFHLRCAA
jgi:hypothetical protein